jgi:DNA-binding Xre family transcriptional regulator
MHGTISCTIPDLLLIAQFRWRLRLSQQQLARETGLSITTVNGLATGKHQRVALTTLGTLCGYFGCQVGELLRYGSPDSQRQPLPDGAVRRAMPPGREPVAVPIRNHLPALLASCTPTEIADRLGVRWNTAAVWKAGAATRFDLPILARICDWQVCTVNDVLTADLTDIAA